MSKELKNITNIVMNKIHENKIKMHSKAYFVMGSLFTFVGLVSSVLFSIFLFGLIKFSLRSHGPMANSRFDQLLSSFPWWVAILAVLALTLGIWLLRKYDFSYKTNFKLILIVFIAVIVSTGLIIDNTGIFDAMASRGPMSGIMKQYFQKGDVPIGQMRNRF